MRYKITYNNIQQYKIRKTVYEIDACNRERTTLKENLYCTAAIRAEYPSKADDSRYTFATMHNTKQVIIDEAQK